MRITDRDMAIMGFLWRWKFATTSIIHEKYFPKVNSVVPYRRLMLLEGSKYLKSNIFSYKEGQIWSLTRKGFDLIKPRLPELKENGFQSANTYHDHLVTALHLGEWVIHRPEGIYFCSEQELRRVSNQNLPSWIPNPDIHRPDGYWLNSSGKETRIVALEVELSRKNRAQLEAARIFYEREQKIHTVLWLAKNLSFGKFLYQYFEGEGSERQGLHQVAIEEDFKKNGWYATIKFGSRRTETIISVLGNANQTPVTNLLQSRAKLYHPLFMNCRKRPLASQS